MCNARGCGQRNGTYRTYKTYRFPQHMALSPNGPQTVFPAFIVFPVGIARSIGIAQSALPGGTKKDLCKRTSLRGSGAQRQPTTCTRSTGARRGGPAIFWLLACKIRVLRRHGAAAMWSAVGLTPSRASVFQCLYRPLACKIRVLRTSKRGSELNGSRPSCTEARHGFCRQKKKES